jgi:hypothetical protein
VAIALLTLDDKKHVENNCILTAMYFLSFFFLVVCMRPISFSGGVWCLSAHSGIASVPKPRHNHASKRANPCNSAA